MRLARVLTTLIPVATFVLLMLGGFVHSVGASLACPDWPLCYGQVFPPMQGGIFWEHSHRLLASAVGLMTLVLAVACTRAGVAVGVAWLGVALVVAQGTLGGLTVIFRLPSAISIAHLATSMVFLAWTVAMHARVRPPAPAPASDVPPPRAGVWAALVAVFLQIVLGALVRHTQSSMACGTEVFTCAGGWLPGDPRQRLQTLHRVTAVLAGAIVVGGTLPSIAWARRHGVRAVRRLGIAAHALILLQWAVGAAVLKAAAHAHVTTLHLGLGALLWGDLVAMAVALGRSGPQRATGVVGAAPGDALPLPSPARVSDLHGAC